MDVALATSEFDGGPGPLARDPPHAVGLRTPDRGDGAARALRTHHVKAPRAGPRRSGRHGAPQHRRFIGGDPGDRHRSGVMSRCRRPGFGRRQGFACRRRDPQFDRLLRERGRRLDLLDPLEAGVGLAVRCRDVRLPVQNAANLAVRVHRQVDCHVARGAPLHLIQQVIGHGDDRATEHDSRGRALEGGIHPADSAAFVPGTQRPTGAGRRLLVNERRVVRECRAIPEQVRGRVAPRAGVVEPALGIAREQQVEAIGMPVPSPARAAIQRHIRATLVAAQDGESLRREQQRPRGRRLE